MEARDPNFDLENAEGGIEMEQIRKMAINYFKVKRQMLDDAFEN